jgi:hypothetical protein
MLLVAIQDMPQLFVTGEDSRLFRTAVWSAIENSNTSDEATFPYALLDLLLVSGSDVNAKDSVALKAAITNGEDALAAFLVSKGARGPTAAKPETIMEECTGMENDTLKFEIFVELHGARLVAIEVDSCMTIGEVKKLLEVQTRIRAETFRLTTSDHVVPLDNWKSLSDCSIEPGSTVQVRLRTGGSPLMYRDLVK